MKNFIILLFFVVIASLAFADNYTYIKGSQLVESNQALVSDTTETQLSATSPMITVVTGTNTHSIKLPNTASINVGFSYKVINKSTDLVTVKDFSDVVLSTIATDLEKTFILFVDGWKVSSGGGGGGGGKEIAVTSPLQITQDTDSATISLGTIDYLDFNTATTPTAFDGRVHFDQNDKTLSIDVDSANGVQLQVGQENYIRAVNKTGLQINDGQVVYINGAQGNRPTIDLALASADLYNKTIGIATQNIIDNAEGMVTTSGVVGGFNTSGFTAGDRLYLSKTSSGSITNVMPSDPVVQVGWALNSTVSGKILVDIKTLSQSSITNIGTANNFYLDTTSSFADNYTLSISPSVYAETANIKAVTSGTSPIFFERFVSGALGRTSIPAGTWSFDIYAGTSNTTGLNEVKFRVNKRVAQSGCTGTFSGAGATRTFTTSGCSPFVAGDANASILLATLIETPTQTAWINGYTSSSQVTVTLTDAGFTNITTSLDALYYRLFDTTTGDINSASELKIVNSVQPAFTVNETDRLVLALFASTDQASSRNITLYYGGTNRFSHFDMPSSVNHNDLANKQGGTTGEFYHLTATQTAVLANTNMTSGYHAKYNGSGLVNGYIYDTGTALGIGTTSPNNSVELVSNAANGFQVTTYGVSGQNVLQRANGSVGSPTALLAGEPMGAVSFRGHTGSGFTGSKAFIQAAAAGDWSTSSNGTNLIFSTTASGSTVLTERLRLFHDGKLGLGTSSPASTFHMYENNSLTSSANGQTVEQAGTGDAVQHWLLSGGQRYTMGIDNSDSDKFKLGTNADLASNNLLTVTTTGKLGVGTTNPETAVHVVGDTMATGYQYSGSPSSDGSFRMYVSGGALITEKRISGIWTEIYRVE